MPRPPSRRPAPDDRLLDTETWETPRRLTRAEILNAAGPDWRWTRPEPETSDDD